MLALSIYAYFIFERSEFRGFSVFAVFSDFAIDYFLSVVYDIFNCGISKFILKLILTRYLRLSGIRFSLSVITRYGLRERGFEMLCSKNAYLAVIKYKGTV